MLISKLNSLFLEDEREAQPHNVTNSVTSHTIVKTEVLKTQVAVTPIRSGAPVCVTLIVP